VPSILMDNILLLANKTCGGPVNGIMLVLLPLILHSLKDITKSKFSDLKDVVMV